ncbi:hypothetical protein MMC21_002974 [Puttea exsequens]|nr:hypothetical protein [Puttea exsequens]
MSTKKFIQQFYHDHQDRLYEDAFKTRGTKYYNDNFDLDCQGVRTHNSFTFYQFASRYLQRFPGPPACVILAVQPRKGTKSRAIADLVRTSVTGQRLRNSTPVVAQVLIPQDADLVTGGKIVKALDASMDGLPAAGMINSVIMNLDGDYTIELHLKHGGRPKAVGRRQKAKGAGYGKKPTAGYK